MRETLNLIHENPHPTIRSLPESKTFVINKGDYLGNGRTAKQTHPYDMLTDTQPHIEVLDPNSGELKTAVLGVHRAVQLKAKGSQEPLAHN